MAVSNWEWLNRDKALSCCLAPVLKVSARLLGAKQRFNKERFQLAEYLPSARYSPFAIFNVLAARMRKLIAARARKDKRPLDTSRREPLLAHSARTKKIPG